MLTDDLRNVLNEGASAALPPQIAKPLMEALDLLDALPNLRLATRKQLLFSGLARDIANGEDTSEVTFILKVAMGGQIDLRFASASENQSISVDPKPYTPAEFARLLESLEALNTNYPRIEAKLRAAGFLGA